MLTQKKEDILELVCKPISKKDIDINKRALEIKKCKDNPLYFIYNYVYIPEIATSMPFKLTTNNLHSKMKRVIRSIYRYNKVNLMASRQLGKSSVGAALMAWALVFHPGAKAIILNMKRLAGLQNLSTIKFIIQHLPTWMVSNKPFISKSEIVTYFKLFNGSRADVFFPSTIHSPSTLARSLSSSLLMIDEAAYIRAMRDIYGSAQQTLSKAREQAKAINYPVIQLVMSTPNGVSGDGEWWYDRWSHGVDSDLLFDDDKWKKDINIDALVEDPSKNTFINIFYHWSEDPTKDEKWYNTQCQEIGDERTINQELDLLFVGTKRCIFSDSTLSSFKAIKAEETVTTKNNAILEVFEENFDLNDYYIISADTAESLEGAYCAIQVFGFRNFNQVAELEHKYGSYTLFGQDIDFVFRWLKKILNSNNIIVVIENNSIGKASIEHLLYHVEDIDYTSYLYKETNKLDEEYGVKTTGMTKPLMVGLLTQMINENVKCIKSKRLINQLGNIEKTNSGSIKAIGYSDLFMAACFAALVRNKKAIEIMPILSSSSPTEYEENRMKTFSDVIGMGSIKSLLNSKGSNSNVRQVDEFDEAEFLDLSMDDFGSSNSNEEEFLPFFSH